MTNEDLKILTPTERAIWAQLGEMQPPLVAMAVERVLVDAIVNRKAVAAATLEEQAVVIGMVAS